MVGVRVGLLMLLLADPPVFCWLWFSVPELVLFNWSDSLKNNTLKQNLFFYLQLFMSMFVFDLLVYGLG